MRFPLLIYVLCVHTLQILNVRYSTGRLILNRLAVAFRMELRAWATPKMGRFLATVLPFTVTPPGAASKEAIAQLEREQEAVLDLGAVMAGASAPTSNARRMQNGKACVPRSWMEAKLMLEAH